MRKLIMALMCGISCWMATPCQAQLQTCPVNINFSTGDLSNWSATTGLVGGGSNSYPAPNADINSIAEFNIQTTGIRVITSASTDHYGKFQTIPVVNGYAYNYSIQLGSTSTSHDLNSGSPNPGGFTRSVSYVINVPPGSTAVPYTMTYAYALVLENGTHNSNEQPLFKATLQTKDSVISCASPQYYLPTHNDAQSGGGGGGGGGSSTGATLDSAGALANGFTNSPELFLSYSGQAGNNGTWLQDVWTKSWTEVTFDLSPYRGQQVTLTFETNNCRPGAHFAYAYVALRNTCAGLEISGPAIACTNSTMTYSIPALTGGTYAWTVPAGWTVISGGNTNILTVEAGANGGEIIAQQSNSCANLRDTIQVTTTPPTVAGLVNADNTVCSGTNSTLLANAGATGNVVNWISSANGTDWTPLNVTASQYTAQNLTATTYYAALVQNGPTCRIDTAAAAVITVDERSVGGNIQPSDINVCLNQPVFPTLQLSGNTGAVVNWQRSGDNVSWTDLSPANQQTSYQPASVNSTAYYRTIVKNGVCPADTAGPAVIRFYNTAYPSASISPDSSSICYGRSAVLKATITTGTNYSWSTPSIVNGGGNGTVGSLPYSLTVNAAPSATTDLVLIVNNAGCPNPLRDTFHINVAPPVRVFAGNDTAVVVGQPLQLNATVNIPEANVFLWMPSTGLNNTTIPNPVALYNNTDPTSITYKVSATTAAGCQGTDEIKVTVFKTGADIFMPSAFTPNGDGHNDQIIPICVGVQQLNYFRIYNRWGQLVFSTSVMGRGWDGRIGGAMQGSSNFVYMVQGIDYTGRVITKKGNLLLVR